VVRSISLIVLAEYYPLTEEIMAIFKNNDFHLDIKDGKLYSEYNHPKYEPGMTAKEFVARNLEIDMDRIIAHISKVELIETGRKI